MGEKPGDGDFMLWTLDLFVCFNFDRVHIFVVLYSLFYVTIFLCCPSAFFVCQEAAVLAVIYQRDQYLKTWIK